MLNKMETAMALYVDRNRPLTRPMTPTTMCSLTYTISKRITNTRFQSGDMIYILTLKIIAFSATCKLTR